MGSLRATGARPAVPAGRKRLHWATFRSFRQRPARCWPAIISTVLSGLRRGLSGGGNQLRQPYIKKYFAEHFYEYPNVNHIHFYGFYIGNYPGLEKDKILRLCSILNNIEGGVSDND